MNNYRIEDPNPPEGATHWDDASISYFTIFCNTLFPGAEFKYVRTRKEGVHELAYFPCGEIDKRAGLWVTLHPNLIDFEVCEYSNNPAALVDDLVASCNWEPVLRHNTLLGYNIYKAYGILESAGVIQHYIVDDVLKKPTAVPPIVSETVQ